MMRCAGPMSDVRLIVLELLMVARNLDLNGNVYGMKRCCEDVLVV
jgi:hypothetical protein